MSKSFLSQRTGRQTHNGRLAGRTRLFTLIHMLMICITNFAWYDHTLCSYTMKVAFAVIVGFAGLISRVVLRCACYFSNSPVEIMRIIRRCQVAFFGTPVFTGRFEQTFLSVCSHRFCR